MKRGFRENKGERLHRAKGDGLRPAGSDSEALLLSADRTDGTGNHTSRLKRDRPNRKVSGYRK